jgi:hypothetical protein
MYGPGVWDADPGNYWQVCLQEGKGYLERCKIQGAGDIARVNNQVEFQRCGFFHINKGYNGGYSKINGMWPEQPDTFFYHTDALQAVGGFSDALLGNSVTINECYIGAFTEDRKELANSALLAKADVGTFKNYYFTNNIVDGGNYTLYPFIRGTAGNVTLTNCVCTGNRFGTWGQGYEARYGPVLWGASVSNSSVALKGPNAGVTWANNTWLQTGRATMRNAVGGKKYIDMVQGGDVMDLTTGLPKNYY